MSPQGQGFGILASLGKVCPHNVGFTRTHTHTAIKMGTFHTHNGFYTVQTVYSIPLYPTPKPTNHTKHSAFLHFK